MLNMATAVPGILETINAPDDLKKVSRWELSRLAAEIRSTIIEVVSANGGHLASSLGVVELTIALHYVFDSPRDRIVWDVGHQAYAHKMLTGRRDRFATLRRHQGLSGFPRITESPYDAFSTGHSSTSVSAGLGISCAKYLKGERGKVVCVVGDGSMTGGMIYEGLNQAGDLKRDLIVILNDNEMSISRNVGAISSLLSRTFSAKYFQERRKELGDLLRSLPRIGMDAYRFAKRVEETFKTLVTPGMLFEAFNFDYFGPIDGHRLDQLIDILANIKELSEPVLLHVTTTKGKGYAPAEKNPIHFHGVGAFEVKTGSNNGAGHGPTYTRIFGDALVELAAEDSRIIAITAAMPEGTGLVRFSRRFPERFFDVGIAEEHGVTFAAGLAAEGFRPVVAIYSTFLQRAYDQILHDVCLESLPVVFALDRGGIVGEDGPTHHGLFDLSFLRSMPNMVVMAPMDEHELKEMLGAALAHPGPSAVRYPRGEVSGRPAPANLAPLAIGRAEVLTEGEDLLILAIGHSVLEALRAREILAQSLGIAVTVVNGRFVKPLDGELILSLAARIPRVITIEENVRQGGFGAAVLETLADAGLTGCRVMRLGIDDRFVEQGDKTLLRALHGVDADAVVVAAKQLLGSGKRDMRKHTPQGWDKALLEQGAPRHDQRHHSRRRIRSRDRHR